jgi:sortase A
MQWLRKLERLLLILGGMMFAICLAASLHRSLLSNGELRRFKARELTSEVGLKRAVLTSNSPDFSLWSEQRVKDYEESLAGHFAPAIAILRISKIHVEVPVLEGTDDLSLNRGVGHVAGTANPGENGNIALAGHRDGFFRGLKDISLGDEIEIATTGGTDTYIVDRITVVDPGDVSVLKKCPHASLTLITCYPFYFIGRAPKRYIVRGSVADSAPLNNLSGTRSLNREAITSAQTQAEPMSKREN